MRRSVPTGLLAVAVLAASCSAANNDAASYELADEIIGSIDQPVTRTVASDGCTRIVVIDEYGFETETLLCEPAERDPAPDEVADGSGPEPASPEDGSIDVEALLADDQTLPPDLFATLAGDVPDDDLRRSLGALSLLLDELDASCGVDPAGWTEGVETAAAEIELIAASVESAAVGNGAVAGHVGTSSARLLARALLERTLLLTGCTGGPGDALVPTDGATLRMNVATATVATAVEHLGRVLRGTDADPLFFHPDELAHLRWMRSESGPVEFVVAGTSQATHGISPTQLGESSRRVVASVAIPGSVAEVQRHWLPVVTEAIDPGTIIWAVGPIDLVVGCAGDGREMVFLEAAARRTASFDAFGWLDDLDPFDRILGPDGNEVYLGTPIGRLATDRYPSDRLGEAVRLGSISEIAIEEHRAGFGPAFERGDYCEDRASLIRSIVDDLQADGREVVFVGMPISPDLVPFYPGGSAGLAQVMNRFRSEVAEPTGAPFVDLTGAIQEPRYWSDWVHPVAEGSTIFTATIAEALTELGIW